MIKQIIIVIVITSLILTIGCKKEVNLDMSEKHRFEQEHMFLVNSVNAPYEFNCSTLKEIMELGAYPTYIGETYNTTEYGTNKTISAGSFGWTNPDGHKERYGEYYFENCIQKK